MKKPSKLEETYHALERLAHGPITDEAQTQLRQAIDCPTSLLVSKAADIAAARGLRDLIPDMVNAFPRFLVNGAKTDKQSNAKISIANALNELEYLGDEVFVAGALYVQMEPAFGGQVDTAVPVRRACAYGLARIGHQDAHYFLVELLVDADTTVRAVAAKALGNLGTSEAEVLLRLKVLTDDREVEVLGECFTSLLAMSPARSMDFVARYLNSDNPALMESAALAIGQSRSPGAFDMLMRCWEDNVSPFARQSLLLPIALLRTDEAFEFLLTVVRRHDSKVAAHAVSVLALYADDTSASAVQEAVRARGDAQVLRQFESSF